MSNGGGNNNNGLYLIVGALLVAVLVVGVIVFSKTDAGEDVVKETVTIVEKSSGDNDKGSSFSLNIDENGFSASTENKE